MSDLTKYESRIQRGQILKVLKVAYPGPASLELLEVTLNDRHCNASPASIKGYIEYLEEKGYVSADDERDDLLGVTRTLVKLSAKGIDLLEGNIPADPGVAL